MIREIVPALRSIRFARGVGPTAEIEPATWSRVEKIAFALFVAGVLGSLFVLVHPWYDLRNTDAGLYVATARAIAEGEGYTHLGRPFSIRPPGFSVMLAPLVGTFGTNFRALNLLVSLLGAAGVILLALHQRPRLGSALALLTALALWLNPGYQRLCNQVLSDVPGTTLLLACLLLDRWAARRPCWRRELCLGLGVGIAAYVRPINLLLVPALVASRLLQRIASPDLGPSWGSFAIRRLAFFAAVAGLVILPWNLHSQRIAPPPPADQTGAYSYATAMWHQDPGDPRSPRLGAGEILSRVPTRLRQIASVLGSRLRAEASDPLHGGVALLLVAGLLVVLLQRRAPAEFFGAGALILLALYFDLRDRLLLPVYVLALPAAVELIRNAARRLAGRRVAAIAAPAAVCLLIALDFSPRRDWAGIEERHRAFEKLCSAIEYGLEPDARLATSHNWHYAVCLDRPVYSLLFAVRRADDPQAAEEIIDKYGINTVVLSPIFVLDQTLIPYFSERYGISKKLGSAYLVRVR